MKELKGKFNTDCKIFIDDVEDRLPILDVNTPNGAYIYGLLLTDGNMYINGSKGHVSLEISNRDEDIIYKLMDNIPSSKFSTRTRNTNFKDNYKSITFRNNIKSFRESLVKIGYPLTDKKQKAQYPIGCSYEIDFWRGVVDGDGSIGYTSDGSPFISLTIISDKLKAEFCMFLENKLGVIKMVSKNKRDGVYNIIVKNEDALSLGKLLYCNKSLYINRKYSAYISISKWVRVKKKHNRVFWSKGEDDIIMNKSKEEASRILGRTLKSIQSRYFRLKHKQTIIDAIGDTVEVLHIVKPILNIKALN